MKLNRFTDEQIIGIPKELKADTPVAELCRKGAVNWRMPLLHVYRDGIHLTVPRFEASSGGSSFWLY